MTTEASAGCLTLTGVPLHVCTTQLFDLVPNGLSRALEMVPLPYRNVKNKLLKFSSITGWPHLERKGKSCSVV